MTAKKLQSKSSAMVRIPNAIVPEVKAIVEQWRGGQSVEVERPLAEAIALCSTGECLGLPKIYQEAWTDGFGHDSPEFLAWALAGFLLREGRVPEDHDALFPWKVIRGELVFYEMARSAEDAIALAGGGVASKGW
jgi:hypothetical protein